MNRFVGFAVLLLACGDVQEKQDSETVWEPSSSPIEEPSVEPSTEGTEDYCDYVYLLERRWSGSMYVPYLWRFDPITTNLIELGVLACPFASGDYLIAMTADQKGQLWFLSNNEYLFKSDPSTLMCAATNIQAFSITEGIQSRSLAFMRMGPDTEDQLFFSSYLSNTSPRQGVLTSLVHNDIAVVGEIPGFQGNSAVMELAGSADGRIFGQSFGVGEGSHFVELNPYTGEVLADVDLQIESGNAFTFAILDGFAWMFLSTGLGEVSEVFRYNVDTQELEYVKTLNTTMLGSAAPTCSAEGNGS